MSRLLLRLAPCLLALAAFLPIALPAAPPATTRQPEEPNANIRFGIPAPADAKSPDAYLIERPQYVLSYNASKKIPNWVCWRLRKEDIGPALRGPFEPDPLLPKGFPKVTTHVYDRCGFDRGHMCPAKDRSATQEDCNATFYLTNVLPQSPNSNRKGWERMEEYCRTLARQGKVLYIACGPAGVAGEGSNGQAEEIGKGKVKVTVPAKLWKVVLVLPNLEAEPRKNTRVIAVIMPNDQSIG
jgi:endonuclease G